MRQKFNAREGIPFVVHVARQDKQDQARHRLRWAVRSKDMITPDNDSCQGFPGFVFAV
jgi:hypothetical protein